MTKTGLKTAEIIVPYFKVGDDFDDCQKSNSLAESFHEHANQMLWAEEHLRKVAVFLEKHKDRIDEIEVFGDTHDIHITAPKDIIDMLVNQELAMCS